MNDCLFPYDSVWPKLAGQVFVAAGAKLVGAVTVGHGSSIWFNCVLRGDDDAVTIGRYTNIQDGAVIHVQPGGHPAVIGDYVTVGHNAVVHGCTIGANCLIGMGAIILTGAEIGENCIIAAGTLIPEGKKIPAGSLVIGSPGRVARTVSEQDIAAIRESARSYHEKSLRYLAK